jgi:sterol desaturase/sphingolipid hydroxylase (fatty acid hydroxylase superfamily)
MKMVGLDFESIVALAVIMSWYTRVYHGNIRSNYGVLKYILVTPQSHRIHHSIEERHWGKNLGTYFTIWDRLFGTLYPHYDEYPATGIPDGRFPCEKSLNPLHLAGNFVRQFFYPFGLVLRRREASVAGAYSWVRR